MVAFGSLSKAEQDLIPASPEDATVEKTAVSGEIRRFLVRDVEEVQVCTVIFRNARDASGRELTVFVSLDRKTVAGKAFIER